MSALSTIVIDARPVNGSKNGVSRYVIGLIDELKKNKNITLILISNRRITYNSAGDENIVIYQDLECWSYVPGTLWLQIRANHICRKFSAKFIIGTQHIIPLLTNKEVHKSVIFHDLVYIKHPETMLRTNLAISKLFCGLSLKYSDNIFCVSDTTRNDIAKIYGISMEKMLTIYPGMPEKTASAPLSENDGFFRFLVVGSLEPRKNITKFLESYFKLREINEHVRLTMVYGHKWGVTSTFDSEILNRALNDPSIEIKYSISDVDLLSIYLKSDALVFPSIYEGFGLPILEAVDYTQVILNEIPVFREISEHIENVQFINFAKPSNQVASDLNRAILTDNSIAYIKNSGRAAFSWKASCDKLLKSLGILE